MNEPAKASTTTQQQLKDMGVDRSLLPGPQQQRPHIERIPATPGPAVRSKLLLDADFIVNNILKTRAEVNRIFDSYGKLASEYRADCEELTKLLADVLQQRV